MSSPVLLQFFLLLISLLSIGLLSAIFYLLFKLLSQVSCAVWMKREDEREREEEEEMREEICRYSLKWRL